MSRSPATLEAIDYIRSGKIGRGLMAKAWDVQLRKNIGHKSDTAVPGVDCDTWIGPAPALPFNENRFHYNWHRHWNFGTGDAGNDGIHRLDQARWALGVDAPVEVTGGGRKLFFDDDQQTPDTITVTFNYPGSTSAAGKKIQGHRIFGRGGQCLPALRPGPAGLGRS